MVSSILPKTNEMHSGQYSECISFVFWENCGDHKLLSRFTDLYNKESICVKHQSYLSFECRSFEVKFEMHLNIGRQEIVHYSDSNVFLIALIRVHPEKLRQQSVWILVQIHIVTGQEFLQKLGFFMLKKKKFEVKINLFSNFCCNVSESQLFFSNLNCSDVLDLKNLQEQVKKVFPYQQLF